MEAETKPKATAPRALRRAQKLEGNGPKGRRGGAILHYDPLSGPESSATHPGASFSRSPLASTRPLLTATPGQATGGLRGGVSFSAAPELVQRRVCCEGAQGWSPGTPRGSLLALRIGVCVGGLWGHKKRQATLETQTQIQRGLIPSHPLRLFHQTGFLQC